MGLFLAATSFRVRSVPTLVAATIEYASSAGVRAAEHTLHPMAHVDEGRDALFYPPVGDWCVAIWPNYFNIHDAPLAQSLSRALDTLVSTAHIYDGDYWAHYLFESGVLVDRFASLPDYFADSDDQAERLRVAFRGSPEAIATRFGVSAESVAPYLKAAAPDAPSVRLFPDDQFTSQDVWLFTDFWRRLGVCYPADINAYQSIVRFEKGFSDRLPTPDDQEAL